MVPEAPLWRCAMVQRRQAYHIMTKERSRLERLLNGAMIGSSSFKFFKLASHRDCHWQRTGQSRTRAEGRSTSNPSYNGGIPPPASMLTGLMLLIRHDYEKALESPWLFCGLSDSLQA